MYFIFGSIIGGLPSNCTKGDMKNCLLRCNEPDHIFKSSEPCLINREQLYLYTIGLLFVLQTHACYKVMWMYSLFATPRYYRDVQSILCAGQSQDCPDQCFAHEQSQDIARPIHGLYHKPWIQGGLCRTIPGLRKSTLCA